MLHAEPLIEDREHMFMEKLENNILLCCFEFGAYLIQFTMARNALNNCDAENKEQSGSHEVAKMHTTRIQLQIVS